MARPPSLVESAVAASLVASVAVVALPAFARNLRASHLAEAQDGLAEIARGAVAQAARREQTLSFPPPAPLTPADVPRGVRTAAPPEAWEHLTWRTLGFRMEGTHAFSFRFESRNEPDVAQFTAVAHGDLDGDGVVSTFEVRGERRPGGEPARVLPGLYVHREVE